MSRYTLALLLIVPVGLGLGAIGSQEGIDSSLFKLLLSVLLFLSIQTLLHVIKVQSRFIPLVGFTKIMLLARLVVEVLILYPFPTIPLAQLQSLSGISGALSILSLLSIGLLRARFPYPNKAGYTKGEPTLRYCPSCGLKLQRRYNPNACPSCSAVFKVRWMDRLPFR